MIDPIYLFSLHSSYNLKIQDIIFLKGPFNSKVVVLALISRIGGGANHLWRYTSYMYSGGKSTQILHVPFNIPLYIVLA